MKSPVLTRRKALSFLAAAGIVPIVSACGGGGSSSGLDSAVADAQRGGKSGSSSSSGSSTSSSSTAFAVTSPAQSSSVSSTFTVSGTAGSEWVNIAVYSGSTKIGADVTPSNGTWSTSVSAGSLTGSQALTVMAFSVAAGQSGGTSTSTTLTVNIGAASTSTSTSTAAVLPYYGINCHYNQGGIYTSESLSTQVSLLKANGASVARQDCWSTATMATLANTVIPGMSGITILPVITSTPTGTSVTDAYTQGYDLGVSAAGYFAGVVPVIEMGNEMDWNCVNNNVDGNVPADYSSSASLYVAYQAGLCNGFRSVDTTGKTKVMLGGIAYLHFGFLQMIVQNIQPSGAAMPTTAATFDMIAWHYYYTGGNMESVNGLSGTYNIFNSIAAISTKPIYFSECGIGNSSASTSASTAEAYIGQAIAQMVSQSQVVGCNWYELYDFTDDYGLYNNSGQAYAWQPTLASFISSNPKS
jgi:hypothetical protein